MREITSLFGGAPYVFPWSGENSPRARHQAAADLAELLSEHPHIHLVGFSHGGNIASEAAVLLPASSIVHTLVTIATPVSGCYPFGGAKLHVNLYSNRDLLQRAGGESLHLPRFGAFGWAKRRYPEQSGVRNVRIDGLSSRGISGSHGDILWWDETWARLRGIIHPQSIP